MNGIEQGDQVILGDDMISTGGTMLALIEAVEKADAAIVDIIWVAEKFEYRGVNRIREETGYQVKTLLQISVSGERSKDIKAE